MINKISKKGKNKTNIKIKAKQKFNNNRKKKFLKKRRMSKKRNKFQTGSKDY